MMTVHKVGALDVAAYADYLTSSQAEERQHAAPAQERRGDYYLGSDRPTAEPLGVWWGAGAAELGLAGRDVDRAELIRVWEGKDPQESEILIRRGGNGEHVAAVDCTFSAPKSVSVVWALEQDETQRASLEAAQTRAVEAALGHIEREAELMRRRINGDIRHEPAGGLVVSRFRHHTSRVTKEQEERGYGADPQLHDHCVVANLALRQPGREDAEGRRWGAIDSRELMQIQMEAGALYRVQLRAEVAQLGYRTARVGDHWEIRGITQQAIEQFSAREREVAAAVTRFTQEHGRAPREDERRNLVVLSRGGKDPNPLGDRAQWAERASQIGGVFPERTPLGPDLTNRSSRDIAVRVLAEVVHTDQPITERSAVFDERELRKWVARSMQGADDPTALAEDFSGVLEQIHKSPELVRLNDRHWSTRDHLTTERFVVDALRAKALAGGHALAPAAIEQAIASARVPLDAEQSAAVRALCDRRGAALLVAQAGTGKGEVARAAAAAHRVSGRRVFALATAGETAQRLGQEISADDARSIDGFIHAIEAGRLAVGPTDVVVVDEASQVETRRRWEGLVLALGDAKVIAVGDPAQLPSIEAGGLLPVLEREIGASHLTHVYRAQDQWARDAWGALRDGRGFSALLRHDGHSQVHLAPTREEIRRLAIDTWDADRLGARAAGRDLSQLIVTDSSNREVDRLNALAQARRLELGELEGPSVGTTFVDEADPDYVRTERLHRGDPVRTVRTVPLADDARRVENGVQGEVAAVDGTSVVVNLDGRLVRIAAADLDALRLGYAQHAYGAQGRTVDRVYALAGGWSTDRESGYVAISRARERSEIFADYDTLGVGHGRTPLEGAETSAVPPAEEDLRGEAINRLAERYAHSRPQLAALGVLAAGQEAAGRAVEAEPVRSNAHALASTKQREYVAALGGEVRDGATWVEASMELDRLLGQPEGEHAGRILAGRLPADEVAGTLELASARRREEPARKEAAAVDAPEVDLPEREVSASSAVPVVEPVAELDAGRSAQPEAIAQPPDNRTPARDPEAAEDRVAPTADLGGAQPESLARPGAGDVPETVDATETGAKRTPEEEVKTAAPPAERRGATEEQRPAPTAKAARGEPEQRHSEPSDAADRSEAKVEPATPEARDRAVRQAQERALEQEQALERQRQAAERELDMGGMEL